MKKNLYEILEVSINASEDEIKSSYKRLSKKYHPDISREENASNRMAEINAANDVLSSKEKRNDYDYLMGFNKHEDSNTAENNYHNNSHYNKAQQYYNDRYKYYTNTYQSTSEKVVEVLTWTTMILGTLFWTIITLTLATINIINADINIDLSDSTKLESLFDLLWFIVISIFLLGMAVLILIYFSQFLTWLILITVALSLISNYDSFLLYFGIIYGSFYLLFLIVENEYLNYVSMFFIVILIFNKQFSEHIWLMLSLIMNTLSILISIFILWPVIDDGEYVGWKQILFSTVSFPIIGGIIMMSSYIIEKLTY